MTTETSTLAGPDAIADVLLHGQALARADLYELYGEMRRSAPVFRSSHGIWFLSRYEDARAALLHKDMSLSDKIKRDPRLEHSIALQTFMKRMLFVENPADHVRQRRVFRRAFTLQSVKQLRPYIASLVDDLLAGLRRRAEFDLMADFADRIPVAVICRLLGVPAEDVPLFREWTRQMAPATAAIVSDERLAAADEAMTGLTGYVGALAQERATAPRDDLLSRLVAESAGGRELSHEELVSNAIFLLSAGSDTTAQLICGGMLALSQHPDQMRMLGADRSLMADAIEELMRFQGPAHYADVRLTTSPLALRSGEIPAGERVLPMIGSADRDPDRFEHPDTLDITRQDIRHLGFSQGAHLCLGAMLARLEAEVAIGGLLSAYAEIRPRTPVTWIDFGPMRGLHHLDVDVVPAPALDAH